MSSKKEAEISAEGFTATKAISPNKVPGWMLPVLALIGVFLVWEIAVRVLHVSSLVLPPPSLILTDLAAHWNRVAINTFHTSVPMVVGFLLSVIIAVPVAMAIAFSEKLERTAYPVILFFQIIPKIAIAPLFIIWFGFGLAPKVLLVFLLSFFPVVVSAIAGFKAIEEELLELAQSTGAGAGLTFFKIRLPNALPSIFTGLKVAATISATAAVVAEFVASDRGLGYLLLVYNGNLEIPMVFGVITVLSLIGLILYYMVEVVERLAIPWHVGLRKGGSAPGVG